MESSAFRCTEVRLANAGNRVAAGVVADDNDAIGERGFERGRDRVAFGAVAAMDAGEILQQRRAVLGGGVHQRLTDRQRG